VVKEIIHSFRIQCKFCDQILKLSKIDSHEH
jgi:hypothetical protein